MLFVFLKDILHACFFIIHVLHKPVLTFLDRRTGFTGTILRDFAQFFLNKVIKFWNSLLTTYIAHSPCILPVVVLLPPIELQ